MSRSIAENMVDSTVTGATDPNRERVARLSTITLIVAVASTGHELHVLVHFQYFFKHRKVQGSVPDDIRETYSGRDFQPWPILVKGR